LQFVLVKYMSGCQLSFLSDVPGLKVLLN
jgi:hypothetical protein